MAAKRTCSDRNNVVLLTLDSIAVRSHLRIRGMTSRFLCPSSTQRSCLHLLLLALGFNTRLAGQSQHLSYAAPLYRKLENSSVGEKRVHRVNMIPKLNRVGVIYLNRIGYISPPVAGPQPPQLSDLDRGRAQEMLQTVAAEVRKHYYDPEFHGLDWDEKVEEAKQKIAKATSMNMAMSHIAAALDTLNDSHTFFIPPEHANRVLYGFQYQIFGDRCLVIRVQQHSDAEAKGIHVGDEVLTLNTYNVNRDDFWKVEYVFSILRPQPVLELVLQDPSGNRRQVEVTAKIIEGPPVRSLWSRDLEQSLARFLMAPRYWRTGNQLLVLKVPEFFFSDVQVADMIGKARKYQSLIVDLRGNPGGSVEALKYFVSGMFHGKVKIADRVGRKEMKPEVAKGILGPFMGKLVVLVDSGSASAAELFARVVQLEKRGLVIGDHTSGSVMEAQRFGERMGKDKLIFYGASITEQDLIMTDGRSLEHTGVAPDEIVLPTPQDLVNGRDPVLARAAEILGVKVSPEEAGQAFPDLTPD
jgi:C-terminal processing protease CtpA/Prc